MKFNRRKFIAGSLATAITSTLTNVVLANSSKLTDFNSSSSEDAINPSGIRTAGIKMIAVRGGKYKVWTKRLGQGKIKVLLVHGGPGLSHEYLESMESFLPEAGIEMYYYDLLGCNNSDQPDDINLYSFKNYAEEIEEVRKGLGLNKFVLYGHSAGGGIALEYALKYQQHLNGLVISNMAASSDSFLKHALTFKNRLSPEKRNLLDALEKKGAFDSPENGQIMMNDIYPHMLCQLKPWPEPFTRSLRHINEKIYVGMQGQSEFQVSGNMKNWNVWNRLHEIKTKTLTIGAKYDEMDPEDMKKMAKLMPNGQSYICQNGSHLCMWDDQKAYYGSLITFLKSL